ncbi:MAG: hypothetical protein O7G84_06710 [Gammaproteobacteria bacterium]|nr:hypothetical protein [Gammaproteobacteria bacterium]
MADKPFPAYEGDGAFFVSYAHEDAALVYPEMAWIGEAGFNLWYVALYGLRRPGPQ